MAGTTLVMPDHVTVALASSAGALSGGGFSGPVFIAAACTALLGVIGGLAAAYITKQSKDQELFLNALNLLTGGTQKRSVGIAIITDYAERRGRRAVAALIFNAQRKHLEDENHHTENTSRSIEAFNYKKMGEIIELWKMYESPYWWRRPSRHAHSALRIESETSKTQETARLLGGKVSLKNGKIEIEIEGRSDGELREAAKLAKEIGS